ncbi:DEKNAAC105058 [Brettanomyces naardenensis]|uniref:DEKNAAC105058 n=1 Tax=Brettanomyces naardenensis TaxID=13370 RepID=A0A448YS70_BRENA|nr:DEKNAAC105058 [Brettanomyces naardenensis]
MRATLVRLFVVLIAFTAAGRGLSEEDNKEAKEDTDPIPDLLNAETFDSTLATGYHVVEFFSPYCPHCMHFKPTWEQFYRDNHRSLESENNLFLNQVDCISSGELCDREGIRYFPNIRFYSAGGKLLGNMGTNYARTAEGLGTFCDDQLSLWSGDEEESGSNGKSRGISSVDVTSLIDKKQLVRMLSGEGITKPMLISFWPSSDKQLKQEQFQGDHKSVDFFKNYPRCYSFRNLWNGAIKGLSQQISKDDISLGYFNCGSNPTLCDSLDIRNWDSQDQDNVVPQIMMILPSKDGGNRIVFNQPDSLTIQDISTWTKRLLDIYKFEDVKRDDIKKKMGIVSTLKSEPGDIPDYSEVSFVLLEDPETHVPEDDHVLRQLLQPIMDMRENVYLYRSTDKAAFLKLLKDQEMALENNYVNGKLDKESPDRAKFSEEMFAARTLSTLPMVICIKSNSLITPVLKSFSPRDTRNPTKVLNFIRENVSPVARPLTPRTMRTVFPHRLDATVADKSEKVLIALMDFKKPKDLPDVGYAISYIYHKFTYLKWKNQFSKLEKERNAKYSKVADLKEKDADYSDIMKTMSTKIPGVFEGMDNDLKIAYMDIERFEYFKERLGWGNIIPDSYKGGDFIVFSRFGNTFWDKDLNGEALNVGNSDSVVDVIAAASFAKLKGETISTPWFKMTLMTILAVVALVLGIRTIHKILRRRRLRANRVKGLGILGVDPDLQSSGLGKFE